MDFGICPTDFPHPKFTEGDISSHFKIPFAMKKSLFFLLFSIFVSVNAHSQTEHLKEINRDIWLPFIDAYGTFNSGKYKSLQSEDFIRAAANNKNLPIPKDYFDL